MTLGLTEGQPLFPLVVLFGLNAVDELDKTAFNVLAPEIRRSFDLGISGILGLVAVIELVAILLGLPLAYWADRRSRVRLAARGATLWGGFSLATGLAPSVGLLAAARAGAGIGRAVVTPTHFSLLADYYPPEIRPKVFGTHRAANSVGQFVGPIVAGGLALWLGWRAPFVLFVVPTVVFVALALRLREPPRGALDRRAAGVSDQAALAEEEAPRFLEGCRMLWQIRSLRRIWYAMPFAAVVIVGLGSLFSIFYEEEFGLNSAQRGLASAVTEPAQLLGLLAGIPIANRLLRKDPALVLRFVALVGVVVAACFATLSVTPYLALVIAMHMVIAASAAVLQPGVFSILSLALPPRVRSLGFAVSALWFLPGLGLYP
ncbi:MAG TPA: MFS transporter, partial [Pseudonocardiaceae bacterium]|nr:MFS transporter [Pseudonocardiaceae bacterium]